MCDVYLSLIYVLGEKLQGFENVLKWKIINDWFSV